MDTVIVVGRIRYHDAGHRGVSDGEVWSIGNDKYLGSGDFNRLLETIKKETKLWSPMSDVT